MEQDIDQSRFVEGEIDLREIVTALKRQRKFILYFSSLFILVGLLLALLLPDIYRINVVLKVPEILATEGSPNARRLIHPATFIKKKIEDGIYFPTIMKKLSLEPDMLPELDVDIPEENGKKKEKYLEISIKSPKKHIQRDVQVLQGLIILLREEYEPYIARAKDLWKDMLAEMKKRSRSLSNELVLAQKQKEYLLGLQREFIDDIRSYGRKNDIKLSTDSQSVVREGKDQEGFYFILDALYRSQLGTLAERMNNSLANISSRITSLKESIEKTKLDISTLKYRKEFYIHNFIETQPVSVSLKPISPHRRVLFTLTALLGFFLSILIALIRDSVTPRVGEK